VRRNLLKQAARMKTANNCTHVTNNHIILSNVLDYTKYKVKVDGGKKPSIESRLGACGDRPTFAPNQWYMV